MFSYPLFSLLHGHRKAHPGVFFLEDLFLFFQVDLGVYLGGHDRAVAEQGLDVFNVNVVLQKHDSEGMAEDMWGHFLTNLGRLSKITNEYKDRLIGELIAQPVDQEVTAVGRDPASKERTMTVTGIPKMIQR